jgi:membrane-bound lytic murein transglycosylase A
LSTRLGVFAVLASSLLLYACAAVSPPPAPTRAVEAAPTPSTPTPSIAPSTPQLTLADLPGWAHEDHVAAVQAFIGACSATREMSMQVLCLRAKAMGPWDEPSARSFLEASFRPERVGERGLLTAYFAPEYEARAVREGPYTAPVRTKPADLVMLDLGQFDASLTGKKVSGHVVDGKFAPYGDRAAIDAMPAKGAIAWMKPEELFFMQIQGSGILKLPEGRRIKVTFNGSNGKPFVGIAGVMRDRGLLADSDTSGDAIRQWLADHRGPDADEIMRQNPRYVFFKASPDDGRQPPGAAGISLIPGRALAMDPSLHPMGTLFWIDASAPALSGAFPVYQRMAVALDTGGAIKGLVRADLYTGTGPAAGVEAGRVRHVLNLYVLYPVEIGAP